MAEGYRRSLVDHLKRTLSKGYKVESLRWALIHQGYPDIIVDKALQQAQKELAEEKTKEESSKKEKPKITYELYDERNRKVGRKSFWKRIFGGK